MMPDICAGDQYFSTIAMLARNQCQHAIPYGNTPISRYMADSNNKRLWVTDLCYGF